MAWVLRKEHDVKLNGARPTYFQGTSERTGKAEFCVDRMFAQRFPSATAAGGTAEFHDLIGFNPTSVWG